MSTPRSSRRDFLVGRAAAEGLLDLADRRLGPTDENARPSAEPVGPTGTMFQAAAYQVQFSRRAMACEFEIYLNAGQYPHADEAALAALDLVERLEDRLSIYRPHSEVSRLNLLARDEA